MTPAPGKKRGRKPSLLPTKIRTTLTLDPAVKAGADSITNNLSDLVERLLKKEIARATRLGPNLGPKGRKMGK